MISTGPTARLCWMLNYKLPTGSELNRWLKANVLVKSLYLKKDPSNEQLIQLAKPSKVESFCIWLVQNWSLVNNGTAWAEVMRMFIYIYKQICSMWMLKVAEGHGPWLYSLNNYLGRQICDRDILLTMHKREFKSMLLWCHSIKNYFFVFNWRFALDKLIFRHNLIIIVLVYFIYN